MKLKKFFLILSLFIVLLLCFSAVSASEDNILTSNDDATVDKVVSGVDSNIESISAGQDGHIRLQVNCDDNLQNSATNVYYISNSSSDGNGSSENPYNWTAAYSAAKDGDEIIFTEGTYSASLNIDKNLTLTGLDNVILSSANFTLNSNKRVSIVNFNINDMAVINNGLLTLDKITMNGNEGITNNEELYIIDSSFSDYTGENTFIVNQGYLDIMTSVFTNITNTKSLGGVIRCNENSNTTIIKSKFIKNSAPAGSVIFNDKGTAVSVNNSIFADNVNTVTLGDRITVVNSIFYNINAEITIADKGSGTAEVSGIYHDDYSIASEKTGILLKNNHDASEKTEMINISQNTQFNVTVNDLTHGFYTGYLIDENNNKFKFTSEEQTVGVIYVSPNGTGDGMSKDNPTNLNYAFIRCSNGGLIYLTAGNYSYPSVELRGDISILADDNVNIKSNFGTWTFSGRNAYIRNVNFENIEIVATTSVNNLTIDNCYFHNCSQAISSNAFHSNINGSIFNANRNSIYILNEHTDELNICNSKFINNTGYCIYIMKRSYETFKCTIINSSFEDNTVSFGAIIYSRYHVNTLEIINSTFLRNKGERSGVYYGWTSNQYIRVYSSTFINNTATKNDDNDVAGVFKLGYNEWWNRLSVYDSLFEGNSAPYAGVVRVDSGVLNFYNTTFRENHATHSGGVIQNTKASVTFYNSTLYNNYAGNNSGVLRIISSGNVWIYNTTFDSNHAGNDAGAIGLTGWGNLYCYDSTFINNSAKRAGAIGVDNGDIKIYNSEFINNTASEYVGAIAVTNKNDIMINASKFIGNKAPFAGAVGSQSGDISISDSYFESNTAVHGGAVGSQGGTIKINASGFKYNSASNASGAIYNDGGQIDVYSSEFINNSAKIQAGVIGVTGDTSSVNIHDSEFINNTASRAGVIGADDGIINIYDSNFTSNSAEAGGAVATTGDGVINIYGSNFTKNHADLAGAVASEGGLITIDKSLFSENTATHGGAVGSNNGTIQINNSLFSENHATVGSGAIFNTGGHILVNASKFVKNKASSGSTTGEAAAIGLTNSGSMEIYSSIFDGNIAGNRGGAIGSADGTMIVGNSNFTNNYALTEGGAIGVTGNANVTIYGSNFNNNGVETQAGAIGIESGSVSITDSKFNNNRAGHGAVIGIRNVGHVDISSSIFSSNNASSSAVFYVIGGELNIKSSYAVNNTASENAGVIGVVGTCNVNIENSTFENNKAGRAGVVGAQGGTVKIANSTFINNNATSHAGVIGTTSESISGTYGNITISNSAFKSNYAPVAGVIGTEGGNITVYNSSFENNKAVNDTVIGAQEGSVKVYSSEFINNHAEYAIGAIGVTGKGSVEVDDSIFTNNSADFGVGVIGSDNGTIQINNSLFSQNHAGWVGAIAITGNANLTIINSMFTENKANSSGVIYGDGEVNIFNSVFMNNSADSQAGVIGVTGGKVNIKDSDFTNNNAGRAGVVGVEEGTVIIEDSYFADNTATEEAGVIATTGTGNITIISSEFEVNSAYIAGVVGAENGTITLKDSKFTKNTAQHFAGVIGLRGTATVDVINSQCHTLCIDSSVFIKNNADYAGVIGASYGLVSVKNSVFDQNSAIHGGVMLINGTGTLNITDSNFTNNKAFNASGVVYANGNVNIDNSKFENNTAEIRAGVIGSTGRAVNITKSVFTNNSAERAGVIGSEDGEVIITGCEFTLNYALDAGAIATTGNGKVDIKNSSFSNNIAFHAGVVGAEGGNITINDCEFNNNSAVEYGGAIGLSQNAEIKIYNSKFTNNGAMLAGVIANIGSGEIYVENSTFKKNKAYYGGVIGAINGTLVIKRSSFDNNTAAHGGVVATADNNNFIHFMNSNFTNNNVNESSGVIYGGSGDIHIDESLFENNTAGDNAGAIGVTATGHVYVYRSIFINNSANRAGAIGADDGNISVYSSVFENNNAYEAGAIGTTGKSNLYISNSNFTKNNASRAGAIGNEKGKSFIINSNFIANSAEYVGVLYLGGENSEVNRSKFLNNTAPEISAIMVDGINATIHNSNFANNTSGKTLVIGGKSSNTVLENNTGLDDYTEYQSYVEITVPEFIFKNKQYNITFTVKADNITKLEGNLTVNFPYKNYTFTVNSTNNTFTVTINTAEYDYGIHSINATYNATNNYCTNYTSTAEFTVSKDIYNATIEVKNATYGTDVIITVCSNLNATFNVTVGNITTTVNVSNGKGSVNLGKLSGGDYNVTVSFAENGTVNEINASGNFTVSPFETQITLTVVNGTITQNATITVNSNVNGTYHISAGGYETDFEITDGTQTITLPIITTPGKYNVVVSYNGSENYTSASANETFAIIGYDSTLNFESVLKEGNEYKYNFTIHLKDVDGKEVDDIEVNYTVVLADHTTLTVTGRSNRTSNLTLTVPLTELSATVDDSKVEATYPFKVLEYLIDYANEGSEIKLSHDYIWSDGDSRITIDKALTVDGNGHTLNASKNSIFIVSGDNVVLKNMTLTNSYIRITSSYESSSNASAVLWTGANGIMDNVKITDSESAFYQQNNYRGYCAAVVWRGNAGLINNTIFENCRQSVCHASAVLWFGDDGTVSGSQFINCMGKRSNYAKGEAEIIHWYGNNGSLINSNFTGSKYYNNGVYGETYYYTAAVASEYYVYFNNAANIINVTFKNSKETYKGSSDNKLYDLYVPDPVEKYVVNFTGSFKKHDTDTNAISNPGWEMVISTDNVLSGNITYKIDNNDPVTVAVNSEGKAVINVSDITGNHTLTYRYGGNDYYNSVGDKTFEFEVIGMITPTYTITVDGDRKIGSEITITVTQDTGDASYTIKLNNVTIDNGYTFTIDSAGEYNITVQNDKEGYNNAANKTYSFIVERAVQALTINVVKTGKIGQEIIFTVSGNQTPVEVKVNGVVNTEGKFTPEDGGEYNITAEVNETEAYYANSTTATVTVPDRLTPSYNIEIGFATAGEPVEIVITPTIADVEYTVNINGVVQNVTDNKITYTPETAGEYTLTLFNGKTNDYNAVSITRTFATVKSYQFITINVNKTAKIDDEVTFTITGNETPVEVKVNGFENREGKFTPATSGEYIISAEAKESDVYYSDSITAIVTVADRITPTYTINVNESVNVGEELTITITPSESDVEFIVTINGEKQTVTDNKITYTPETSGKYTIIVSNNQTNTYNAVSTNEIFTASKQYQSVVINVESVAEIGEEVLITVSGNYTPVVVRVNGIENSEGKFTPAEKGHYIISAEASDSNAYYSNITFTTVTVGDMITPTYEIIVGNAIVGNPVSITIIPSHNIIYTVTVNGTSQNVSNNNVSYTPAAAGEYIITVSNIASATYNAASVNKTFTVLKQSQTIVIEVAETANVGQVITFNISGNQTPVEVKVNDVVNTESNFTPLETGIYVISASASESETYYSTSASVNVSVSDRITPTYTIKVGTAVVSNQVVITITPSADVEYNVTINGVAQKVNNNKVIYTPTKVGSYSIVVSNGKYSIYNASNATATFNVKKDTTTITGKSAAKSYKASKTKKLSVTLKNSKGKSLGTVKITLKVNKKLTGKIGKKLKKGYAFTVKFNSKGVGTIKLTAKQVKGFKKGTYKFTVIYKGNANYNAATKNNIKMTIK